MAVRELPPDKLKTLWHSGKFLLFLDHTTVKLTMLTAIWNALIDGEQWLLLRRCVQGAWSLVPRFSLSSHVRTESLYGIKLSTFFFFLFCRENRSHVNCQSYSHNAWLLQKDSTDPHLVWCRVLQNKTKQNILKCLQIFTFLLTTFLFKLK